MRIIHVTGVFLPRLGGIELQVDDLSIRQLHSGHHPIVLTTTAPGADGGGAVPVLRLGQDTSGSALTDTCSSRSCCGRYGPFVPT